MKPLLLSLVAFGPFAAKEEVDFTRLGSHPLFLINGPTGAGKSSILDAICFALYGQTTSADRDPAQMRCDFAEPALLTEITLEFGLGEKQYRIRRVPQQEKPKKHGKGTTSHPPEAQLWGLDGSDEGKLLVPKKVKEATDMVEVLIGLDVEQFRQVMVLPQGKFRDLLLADSRDREKIFSQLFQTTIYKRIEDLLRSKASGIKQAVESHQNQIRGLLQAAEVNTEQEVADSLQALAPNLTAVKLARDKAAEDKQAAELLKEQALQLTKRFAELAQKQTQLTALKAEEPAIKQKRQALDQSLSARSIQPAHVNAQAEAATLTRLQQEQKNSAEQVTATKQALKLASEALTTAKDNAQALEVLNKQRLELDQLQLRNLRLGKARDDLLAAEETLDASTKQLASKQQALSELEKEQQACDIAIKKLQKELSALASQQVALSELATKLEQRQELEAARKQESTESQAEATASGDFKSAEQLFEDAGTHAIKTEMGWHAGQASLLARELKENEPCPVCGSAEHPAPAKDINLVDKGAVDAARHAETEARQAKEQLKQALDKAINALALTRKDSQRLTVKLGPLAEQSLKDVEEAHGKGELAVKELLAKQEQQQNLTKRSETIKAEQVTSTAKIEADDNQLNQHKGQQVKANTLLDQLLSTVPEALREAHALVEKIDQVNLQISQLSKALEAAEKAQGDARSASDKASTHYNALAKQLVEQAEQNRVTGDAWSEALNKSTFATEQDFQQAMLEDDEQEALKVTLQQWQSDLDALNGMLKQLQQDVGDKSAPELDAIELALTEKVEVFQQVDENWRNLDARNKQLKDIQEKLDEAHKKNVALETEYKVIGTLSDVANGQTGNKISLQRFVLSVLLDDVLIQASQRLSQMSKGRYQLVRKEDRAKRNKASGLELEVEDGYSGKARGVATLSGGESFMAALSLALGLSDVVQSYAGGIKLDTLFIDEGFGSLDPESLDLAIRTLIDLQASGRMIGIISHVSELKEQMALRLDVKSGRSGSHINTITL